MHAVAILLALLGALMGVSNDAHRERKIVREFEASIDETRRYVDLGVRLTVVEMDREATAAFELAAVRPEKPPVRELRSHLLGGIWDTWDKCFVGPSESPREWQCSVDQEPLILHPDDAPLYTLIQGSEGAGKTACLAMWLWVRVLEHAGHHREIGGTAPTNDRLGKVEKGIAEHWAPHWYRHGITKHVYRTRCGPVVQLVSAHQRSEAAGSPIQGDNWVACASDEMQDHFDREADITARGRSAPGGRYKRLCTSTFKDSTEWRDHRDRCERAPDWRVTRMVGLSSPFVWPAHWQRFLSNGITSREYQRRVLAMDVPPESQLYFSWQRILADGSPGNLRPLPLGAVDITDEVLAAYRQPGGGAVSLLIGHDPGKRQHVSVFLKAYRFPEDARRNDPRPRWFVVDEVTTPDATVHTHAQQVLKRARDAWHVNRLDYRGRPSEGSPQLLVRIDPHTNGGDEHPGQDVYATWRSLGMLAKAAAYQPGTTKPQTIKRESRIDMVNTLLCQLAPDGPDLRRLFVLSDDTGKAAAPRLVKSFETMERDESGKAENDRKDRNDLSHWPAAVGYALWQLEHARAFVRGAA